MKPDVTISIGICSRNGENFLDNTLKNLFNTNYSQEDYEVIVCNHGSTDRTSDILRKYCETHFNLKIIDIPYTEENRAQPRNAILQAAQGEIIILIDQDILVSDNFINEHLRIHRNHEHALVAGYTFGKVGMGRENLDPPVELDYSEITKGYEFLQRCPDFIDVRQNKLVDLKKKVGNEVDLSHTITPFRAFWTCNLSFCKADLHETGFFDENYQKWGVEDMDFAYRFQLAGKKLIFSTGPWSFHSPHKIHNKENFISWQNNLDLFFSKFPNRELEYYKVFTYHYEMVDTKVKKSLNNIQTLAGIFFFFFQKPLPSPHGSRLGLFIADKTLARKLQLNECFNPFLDASGLPERINGCRYWSLLGLITPFKDREIDETFLVFDYLLLFDDFIVKLILLEVKRITKKVILYHANSLGNEYMIQRSGIIQKIINGLCFDEVEEIN